MMDARTRFLKERGERGAVIIHVAIALMALLVFTAFIIDSGVMWVSRRQAQNVADAGALAGAIAYVYQGGSADAVTAAAHHFAAINPVWGEGNSPANVVVTLSGPGSSIPPCNENPGCVRVDVMRNMPGHDGVWRGNALPTYFLGMVGMTDQGVRATATAETANGTAITCLLPFAVIDRWADNYDDNPDNTYFANDSITNPGIDGWSANDDYQSANGDVYIGPYTTGTEINPLHTGWKVAQDWGRQLIVKAGDIGDYSTGWAQRIDLFDSTGARDYNWNILNCNPTPIGIATAEEPCAPAPGGDVTGREINGCVSVATGMAQGPTVQNGINVLTANDSALQWDPSVIGPMGLPGAPVDTSVAGNPIRMNSMRIRPIVIFDIAHYEASVAAGTCTGTRCIGKVANIVGFFIQGTCGQVRAAGQLEMGNECENPNKEIVGRIVSIPGQFIAGTGTVSDDAAFIQTIRLVR